MTAYIELLPALLRLRRVAALILHRAGYDRAWIAERLGETGHADPAALTPELLTGAARYLRDIGFSYYRIPEVIANLRAELDRQTEPEEPRPLAEPEPEAWGHGVLFDLAAGLP